ncbi:MAG: TetR/AcrR family transcriptional regulator [Alphaproteobacteria bacterium]|nr:TetR/AcrR family transcriptional regulator [Alphaproteobacteria bacterium]
MVKVEPSLREPPQSSATIDRILDAAEELFAEQGIAGTSVRTITEKAKVNVAAVNYHFDSKENLVRKVLERRAANLEHERTIALDRIEAKAKHENREPAVIELVEAMIDPIVDLALSETSGWQHFIRFVSRLAWEPGFEQLEPPESQVRIFDRFEAALLRAVPHLADDPMRKWRLAFMRSAVQQSLMMITMLKAGKFPKWMPAAIAADATPNETIKRELSAFLAAGLAAPKT